MSRSRHPALAQRPGTLAALLALATALPAAELDGVRALAAGALVERDVPGLSVAVVRHDELVWAEGFGLADVESRVPARADTVYRIASLSKPITAVAVLQLVERHFPGAAGDGNELPDQPLLL
jgi:CubicO group peptidase (beta-lactamase class C family)